jgi:redox-sensitive bicupin YhaK (pirin superfamily)
MHPNPEEKCCSILLHALKGSTGPHPHRGIATLTYVLSGEARHFDSAGHQAVVRSGGVQWMKAGNGVVHDEILTHDSERSDMLTHGFQFWINLPSEIKKEKPDYRALQAEEVPTYAMPHDAGTIKIILGSMGSLHSPIPVFARAFLYHVRLEVGKSTVLNFNEGEEVAAFLPTQSMVLNGKDCDAGEFIEFDRKEGEITLQNHLTDIADVLVFGGEPYTEPIVAEGPFVMNSKAEIADAYRDYFAGKYGELGKS